MNKATALAAILAFSLAVPAIANAADETDTDSLSAVPAWADLRANRRDLRSDIRTNRIAYRNGGISRPELRTENRAERREFRTERREIRTTHRGTRGTRGARRGG